MEFPTTFWVPDQAVLRKVSDALVVGIGEDSAGSCATGASRALASAVDIEPTLFPEGHIGFAEELSRFAERLREVLAAQLVRISR